MISKRYIEIEENKIRNYFPGQALGEIFVQLSIRDEHLNRLSFHYLFSLQNVIMSL